MANPIIKIIDVEKNEEIERPMNATELKVYESVVAKSEASRLELENKATARQSALEKLAALGLTEAEIQALAG